MSDILTVYSLPLLAVVGVVSALLEVYDPTCFLHVLLCVDSTVSIHSDACACMKKDSIYKYIL